MIELVRNRIRERGALAVFIGVYRFLLKRIGVRRLLMVLGAIDDPVTIRRKINFMIDKRHSSRVAYGPFKGFQLDPTDKLKTVRAARILGLWEKEVIDAIAKYSERHNYLIDIGAADGFYAVGAVSSGYFKASFNFEKLKHRQNTMKRTASLNNCLDKVHIFGTASVESLKQLDKKVILDSLIVCDVEGFEFSLLSLEILKLFRNSTWIIEVHESHVANGSEKLEQLVRTCSTLFRTKLVTTGARDLSQFSEVELLQDDHRWLICSDGRGRLGKWLILEPKI